MQCRARCLSPLRSSLTDRPSSGTGRTVALALDRLVGGCKLGGGPPRRSGEGRAAASGPYPDACHFSVNSVQDRFGSPSVGPLPSLVKVKGPKMKSGNAWIAAGLFAAMAGGTAASAQHYRDQHQSAVYGRGQSYNGQDHRAHGRAGYDRRSHEYGRDGRPRCNHYKLKHHVPCFR